MSQCEPWPSLVRTWDIRVHRDPGTQEGCDDATAHNVPEGPAPIRVIAGERSDLKLVLRDNR